MKIGDRVIVNTPNRYLREKVYWQPFEVLEIRKQVTDTIVRLRGLILPNVEILGDSIHSLSKYKGGA